MDALLARGAEVRVVDDLSSGRLENIQGPIDQGNIEFVEGNLLDQSVARKVVDGVDVVFHLAAAHGGRSTGSRK